MSDNPPLSTLTVMMPAGYDRFNELGRLDRTAPGTSPPGSGGVVRLPERER